CRQPERQLHPLADALFQEERVVDPGDVGAGQELFPGDAFAGRVEDARSFALERLDEPEGEVADVDELDVSLGWSPGEHAAAAGQTMRSVGEPSGRIVGADDQTRPDGERPVPVELLDRALAEGLQRAVVLVRV